jgi:hypothetical protein
MANTKANFLNFDNITSLKDGAYKQALATDKVENFAQYCLDTIKGFPEVLGEEVKEQLYDGYRLRFNEKNPAKVYAIVNDHYVLIDGSNPELNSSKEKVSIGCEYAFSFTQQQIGRMSKENPYLYEILTPLRKKVNTYCSNRLGDLKRQAKTILNRGKARDRSETLEFNERIESVFNDKKTGLVQKCINAKKRGDDTANVDKLKQAIKAFNTVWLKA